MQLRSGRVIKSQTSIKPETSVKTGTIVKTETTVKIEPNNTELSYQPAIIYNEDKRKFLIDIIDKYIKNTEVVKGRFLKMNEVIKLYELLNNHYDFINSEEFSKTNRFIKISYDKVLDLEKDNTNTDNSTEKAIKERFKSTIEIFKNKYEKSH